MKRPFIIDCDTGTDDAIAICAAMGCEEVEIVGITSVNGNVAEKYTSTNNLNLVEYLDKDIPVCHGAVFPIAETCIHSASSTHGATGLGNVILPQATKKEFEKAFKSTYGMTLKEYFSEMLDEELDVSELLDETETEMKYYVEGDRLYLIDDTETEDYYENFYIEGDTLVLGGDGSLSEAEILPGLSYPLQLIKVVD